MTNKFIFSCDCEKHKHETLDAKTAVKSSDLANFSYLDLFHTWSVLCVLKHRRENITEMHVCVDLNQINEFHLSNLASRGYFSTSFHLYISRKMATTYKLWRRIGRANARLWQRSFVCSRFLSQEQINCLRFNIEYGKLCLIIASKLMSSYTIRSMCLFELICSFPSLRMNLFWEVGKWIVNKINSRKKNSKLEMNTNK